MSALRGQVSPGAASGAALCQLCQLRGRARGSEGEGTLHYRPSGASRQPQPNCGPPGQGAEGPCPWQLGSLCAPPPSFSATGRPPAPLCPAAGSCMQISHLAPSSRRPPVSPRTPCALTETTCRVSVPAVLGSVLHVPTYGRSGTRLSSQLRPFELGTLLPRQLQAAPSSLLTSPSRTELGLSPTALALSHTPRVTMAVPCHPL